MLPGDALVDEVTRLLSIVSDGRAPSRDIVAVADALTLRVADQVKMEYGETVEPREVVSCAKHC